MGEPNEDMIGWAEETGTTKCAAPPLSVKDICEFLYGGLADKDMEEIEDFLCKVGAYNLWLRNTSGSVLAMIRHTEQEFNALLAKGYRSMGKQFASNDVKDAMVCEKSPKAHALKRKLTKLRMKYDKISKIPQSIDASIRTIENAVRRRNGA